MNVKLRSCIACFVVGLVAFAGGLPASAETAYPMLMSLHPVAARTGQTSEHVLKSRYSMAGAYQVLVSGTGVRGEVVLPEPPKDEKEKEKQANLQQVTIKFHVDADALPGVRDFRIATPSGASTVGQVVIVQTPVTAESGNNNTPADAMAFTPPAALCGAIERSEDVDCFRFEARAGQILNFHVQCQRLQDRIHDLQQHADPILTIRDAMGNAVAASDNFFYGDCFASVTFPRDGQYMIEIRDVRYQGNQYWEYCLEVSEQPFVRGVHPLGLAQGQAAQLELVGYQLPTEKAVLSVERQQSPGLQWERLVLGDNQSNPAPRVVSQLPVFLERRGNDRPEQAQQVQVPAGISGRIESEGDIDCFAFAALKGEAYSFEVVARRGQSALDSHLRILDSAGKQLALNDDLRLGKRTYADSWIENWVAPADGMYVIELRDLHLRGGAPFVYFIEVTRSEPYFELYLDTDKTQLTPGTSGAIYVSAERKNGFSGEIVLAVDGLPPGVKAHCGKVGTKQDGCIILTADPDASPAAANITITGRAEYQDAQGAIRTLSATALPYQETYQPGGGRGHWPVEMHTVAVGAPADILAVEITPGEIALKPGESQELKVTLKRAEGFDKNVTLDVTYNHLNRIYGSSLPTGVTLDTKRSKTLLTGSNSEGLLVLTAAKDAPAGQTQVVPVMANVSLNFVMKATYAAPPLIVRVVE